ncbi:Hypothetical predicted protein [Pelobates cultripes]|uniref:Uncharacterized protein n=1 Tax=Pelobates cultripes TaxID=61616 RepID=A0AAD1S6E7_PELCU|nr:Hypothetical predicted protein [Pelobates cultripes]
MKRLWAGNKAFLPVKFHNPASSTCIVSIARYSSWQVAYILWGYMIMNFVQACFGLIFVYLIVYPIRDGEFWILLSAILQVMIPFGTVYLLVAFQTLVATKFFLQNKISNDDKQKPLALNNRMLYLARGRQFVKENNIYLKTFYRKFQMRYQLSWKRNLLLKSSRR